MCSEKLQVRLSMLAECPAHSRSRAERAKNLQRTLQNPCQCHRSHVCPLCEHLDRTQVTFQHQGCLPDTKKKVAGTACSETQRGDLHSCVPPPATTVLPPPPAKCP